MNSTHNVVIIGGGCAGYTAAIYAGRAQLKPILIEGTYEDGLTPGGQLTMTTEVENYPGFVDGINGGELVENMKKQAQKWDTLVIEKSVTRVDFTQSPFEIFVGNEMPIKTLSVIIATGATAKRLSIIGEDKYWNNGISACAVCDGALPCFRKKPLAVIGGGDSAMEEALFLTKYASRVYIVHRSKNFRASKIMLDRAKQNEKIEFITDSTVIQADGDDMLRSIQIKNILTNEIQTLTVSGLFYAIGHTVNTAFLKDSGINLDADGYILTEPNSSHTNIKGIFAAGDVQDKHYRQAITACGSGCMAALDANAFIELQGTNDILPILPSQ